MVSEPSSVPFVPWNLPIYSQGSIEQVEQATVTQSENDSTQCRIMSGGWSGPPSCPRRCFHQMSWGAQILLILMVSLSTQLDLQICHKCYVYTRMFIL
ncbi:hypothetical protein MKX01_016165, partial [Papaver californicum]